MSVNDLRGIPECIQKGSSAMWGGDFAPAPSSTVGAPMSAAWSADAAMWDATAPPTTLMRSSASVELQQLRTRIQKVFTGEPIPEFVMKAGENKAKQLEERLETLLSERGSTDSTSKDNSGGWMLPWFRKKGALHQFEDVREELERESTVKFSELDEVVEKTVALSGQLTEAVESLREDLKKHGDFAQTTMALIDGLSEAEEKLQKLGLNPSVIQSEAIRSEVDRYVTGHEVAEKLKKLQQARLKLAYLTKRCPWLASPKEREDAEHTDADDDVQPVIFSKHAGNSVPSVRSLIPRPFGQAT